MEPVVYSVKEIQAILNFSSPQNVYNMEKAGIIRRVPKIGPLRYYKRDIDELVGKELSEYGPAVYRKTLKENERLRERLARYQRLFRQINITSNEALLGEEVGK